MSQGFERTTVPGIYRRGSSYVVKERDATGRQVTRSVRTMAEAKTVKANIRAAAARGELRPSRRITFADYAAEWIETYRGRTSRGFRESTRDGYRQTLTAHANPYFGRMLLAEIEPRDIKQFMLHLSKKQIGTLKDGSPRTMSRDGVRKVLATVKALLATAFEDGVIRVNPAANVRLPIPERDDDAAERRRALSPEQLQRVLALVRPDYRLLISFLAATGLRIGECVALRWGDVDLDAGTIRVRRTFSKGELGPPKSRFGTRTVPLPSGLANNIRKHRSQSSHTAATDPVFSSPTGGMLAPGNLLARVMKPAAREAGVPWATLHSLRHTYATNLFRAGCNVKQVQRLLGHHSAAFTLETYVHVLPEDMPDVDFLDGLVGEGV